MFGVRGWSSGRLINLGRIPPPPLLSTLQSVYVWSFPSPKRMIHHLRSAFCIMFYHNILLSLLLWWWLLLLSNLLLSTRILFVVIKEGKKGWACGTNRAEENFVQGSDGENWNKQPLGRSTWGWEDNVKKSYRNNMGFYGLGSPGSEQGPVAGSCRQGNEAAISTKWGKFLDYQRDWQTSKTESASCS
jgi:hypothetical protein